MVLRLQARRKGLKRRFQHLQPSGIQAAQSFFVRQHLEGRAVLRPCFGQQKTSRIELEKREWVFGGWRGERLPVQPARNHEVQGQPEIAVKAENNPLAEPRYLAHRFAEYRLQRRRDGTQKKRAADGDAVQRLADYALPQRL